MSIQDIVNVQISRETTAPSQTGFGTLMILGSHKVFNERIRHYQSAESILQDGFAPTSPEYIAASRAFAQRPQPVQVAIGRRSVDNVTIEVIEASPTSTYNVIINDQSFSYTAQDGSSIQSIAGALVDAINADNNIGVVATDNTDGSFDLNAEIEDYAYKIQLSPRLQMEALIASGSIIDDLTAINLENDDWYGLMITERNDQIAEAVAQWTETHIKIFGYTSSSKGIIQALSESDIAARLKDGAYARSFIMYHEQADSEYPEAAWFGRQLPTAPGSTTWAFKTLNGIPTSNVTTTARNAASNKNANTYELRHGAQITYEGKVAEGEYIDVIRGIDWLQARIGERIYGRLVNTKKIPYTDQGVGIIEAELRAQLDQAVAQGVLANNPAPVITVPKVGTISPVDRANRYLPNIHFTARLAGAIHALDIMGVVSI